MRNRWAAGCPKLTIVLLIVSGCVPNQERSTLPTSTFPPVTQPSRTLPSTPVVINVDSCGADPWDADPDSSAIQTCLDKVSDGATILFTSGVNTPGYHGYMIDKTIFLVGTTSTKSNLVISSTDPSNHALLSATRHLRGFVIRLYARSRVTSPGEVDNVTISHLNINGGRDIRVCYGEDSLEDGRGDNWGSWLPECSVLGDSWCRAGTLAMQGAVDWDDTNQGFNSNPSEWSTGLLVTDVFVSETECGSAINLLGANSTVEMSTVDTAGDHVHLPRCSPTDPDEPLGAWSDGITFTGPNNTITNNTVLDASDVGIVFFGGHGTTISHNTVLARAGNHGMFAGIAVHPWSFGEVSGLAVTGNKVVSEGSTTCGGVHAGINIGPHMWGGGCINSAGESVIGNPDACSDDPVQPHGTACPPGGPCQVWAFVGLGQTLLLSSNSVYGTHVNYLVEGLDLEGEFLEPDNTSGLPRMTDWEAAKAGCAAGTVVNTWGPTDRVAHHPSISGWTDQPIHCER